MQVKEKKKQRRLTIQKAAKHTSTILLSAIDGLNSHKVVIVLFMEKLRQAGLTL